MKDLDSPNYFPQYLDSQVQVLSYEADEVVCFIMVLAVANKAGKFIGLDLHTLITWASVIGIPYFFRHIKQSYPNGFLKHLIHMAGLRKYKYYPNPFIKEFTE